MSLFTPRIVEKMDGYERGRFLLAWRFSLTFSFIFFLLSLIYWMVDFSEAVPYIAAFFVSSFCALYIHIYRHVRFVLIAIGLGGMSIVGYSFFYMNNLPNSTNFIWGITCILITFFGLGSRWGIFIACCNAAIIASYFLFFDEYSGGSTVALAAFQKTILLIEIAVALFSVVYIMLLYQNVQLEAKNQVLRANQELSENNRIIKIRNNEKTILLKEIHHRVKNNLQIIVSLLRLQRSEMQNSEAKNYFSEAISRIMVMSSVHQKLYQKKDVSQIDLAQYIEDLSEEIKTIYSKGAQVRISLVCLYEKIDLKTVVPVGP